MLCSADGLPNHEADWCVHLSVILPTGSAVYGRDAGGNYTLQYGSLREQVGATRLAPLLCFVSQPTGELLVASADGTIERVPLPT